MFPDRLLENAVALENFEPPVTFAVWQSTRRTFLFYFSVLRSSFNPAKLCRDKVGQLVFGCQRILEKDDGSGCRVLQLGSVVF